MDTVDKDRTLAKEEEAAHTAAPVREDALKKVVDDVRKDAQSRPGEYLNDAIVPEGGE